MKFFLVKLLGMLDSLKEKCKIENDKFYIHIGDCGNTVFSISIALYHPQKKQLLQKNIAALLAGFGVAYSWSVTIIKTE